MCDHMSYRKEYNYIKMATELSDYEFVEDFQDELMCSICSKEPQMVNFCEQRFCKNCLTERMTNNKTCPHCPIQCGADIFRGALDSHCNEKCPKRRVQCQYCKSEGEYQMITGGHTDTCPCYPLACPQACGAEVLRKDLTAHQGVCPLEPVACPFSDTGCKVKVHPVQYVPTHDRYGSISHCHKDTAYSTETRTWSTEGRLYITKGG